MDLGHDGRELLATDPEQSGAERLAGQIDHPLLVRFRDAQHVADHRGRQAHRDIGHEIDLGATGRIDRTLAQILDDALHLAVHRGSQGPDLARGEAFVNQLAGHGVHRRIEHDHGVSGRVHLARLIRGRHPVDGRERRWVRSHRGHVIPTRQRPERTAGGTVLVERDRPLLAAQRPDGVKVVPGPQDGIGQVYVVEGEVVTGAGTARSRGQSWTRISC